MTTPRSHSQEGSGPPRGFAPRLPISIAFTWPPTVFGPHSSQPVAEPDPPCPPPPKSGPRVKCPARRDLGGQALPPFTVPAVRPPRAPRLCGSLESRRVRGRSLGSCKVSRGRSLAQTAQLLGDGGPTCTHSTDARTKPKPSSRGLQNFPPPTPRAACIPTTFRCGARSGRASPGARPPCGVRSPQAGGSPGTSESARAALPRRRRRGSSPQPARWPAGTHLKEGETEAQRGPATSARSHCTAASSGAGGGGLGDPASPRDTHSRSCPRAPAPPRRRSGQRPWCPRLRRRGARPSQALGWRRLRGGRSGVGSSAGGTPGPVGAAGSAWGRSAASYSSGGRRAAVLARVGFAHCGERGAGSAPPRGRKRRGGGAEGGSPRSPPPGSPRPCSRSPRACRASPLPHPRLLRKEAGVSGVGV